MINHFYRHFFPLSRPKRGNKTACSCPPLAPLTPRPASFLPYLSFCAAYVGLKLEVGSVSPKNTKGVLLKNVGDASLGWESGESCYFVKVDKKKEKKVSAFGDGTSGKQNTRNSSMQAGSLLLLCNIIPVPGSENGTITWYVCTCHDLFENWRIVPYVTFTIACFENTHETRFDTHQKALSACHGGHKILPWGCPNSRSRP